MVAPGMDYTYSLNNFVGVNISMAGGLYYARIAFRNKQQKSANEESDLLSSNTEASRIEGE